MKHIRIIATILFIAMLTSLLPMGVFAYSDVRTQRTVYLHAQGEDPKTTPYVSNAYVGEETKVYFAIDDPNKGGYDASADKHEDPQFDLNGYTLTIYYDPAYFDLASDESAPIVYEIPGFKFDTTNKDDEEIGDDTGTDVPQKIGYFVYRHKHTPKAYKLGEKEYNRANITVFYSGGYVPQKKDPDSWYNLAHLPLIPKITGSTELFIDVDSGDEITQLELFAKNTSEELSKQTFGVTALNGGRHTVIIKDRTKPSAPVAAPGSGKYVEKVSVSLETEGNNKIFYTIDGSDPASSITRIEYTGPFDIEFDTDIKVCAYRESDGKYSSVAQYSYQIVPDRPYLFAGESSKKLIPDYYSENSAFDVYVSDDDTFKEIDVQSEVYYTFSDADDVNPVVGTNPDTEWVLVSKAFPVIKIDKKKTVRLFTDNMGQKSETAVYHLSVNPKAPEADHPSATYNRKIDVRLTCDTAGADIYYTIDGSDPKNGIGSRLYDGIPITLTSDTTLRAVSCFDGQWSDKVSYFYLFNIQREIGVDAFYPSGVYEGSTNVTLTPYNPAHKVFYRIDGGNWAEYDKVIFVDSDTVITAKAVEYEDDGTTVVRESEEFVFTYKIKPLPPLFAPESTQFTNADKVTIYTPESTAANTDDYELWYTTDDTDPIKSPTAKKADDISDSVVINIDSYKIISAVVIKNGESYSQVVKHSYDIVKMKPVKPLTTLVSGYYTLEIGQEKYTTQFMPVPGGTQIYYTIADDGGFCPDPVPGLDGTYLYDGTKKIPVNGKTTIKAVAVNAFGIKSDVGIFNYVVTPQAPEAAPSATVSSAELPLVPVDAVKGSDVTYTVGNFTNTFVNTDSERFYIDMNTGSAYRDRECQLPLGRPGTETGTGKASLEIYSELDGVLSDVNKYVYSASPSALPAPPYADKKTGTYEEIKIDDQQNIFLVNLYSLNKGARILYRLDNEGQWLEYDETKGLRFAGDTILQIRCEENSKYSSVVSYAYDFVPLAPIITLASGTYLLSDNPETTIEFDSRIPDYNPQEPQKRLYTIHYRRNGDLSDTPYNNSEILIDHTMSVKAYVKNEITKKTSAGKVHYYIIEQGSGSGGSVYVANPFDTDRIAAQYLGEGDYAEGIKLVSTNKTADIHYYYTYTRKTDGRKVTSAQLIYNVDMPIIPTKVMDDITIYAWLEDENGRIDQSDSNFIIDFVYLEIPEPSLEAASKVEFDKGTKYTIIDNYPGDKNIILYYTTDGSDPSDPDNKNRKVYSGETLSLDGAVTIRTVYFSACGKCKIDDVSLCTKGVYGEVGTFRYTVPKTVSVSSGGGGGGIVDKTRKYTKDIFGNEHPTHVGYINGYPDGSVRPEGNITRDEIAAILYRVTNHEYEKPFSLSGTVFWDVPDTNWAVFEIEYMADKGVILGYPEGDYRPSGELTRSEFAAMIYRFTGVDEYTVKNPFTDLDETHWAYKEILSIANSGLVVGYEDGTFRPDDNISRSEVMTIMNRLLGRNPLDSYVKELEVNPFTDLTKDLWCYTTVLEATITHNYYLNKNGFEYKWEDVK